MDIWLVAFIGGLIGAVLMDVCENKMAKYVIASGVTGHYIGRWLYAISKMQFSHKDIQQLNPVPNEILIAQVFHFVIGGGVVALGYPLLLVIFNIDVINHLLLAGVFGLLTCV